MNNVNQENPKSPFKAGGTITEQNCITYVRREADALLETKLKALEYVYIFNSRQMGKSSVFRTVEYKLKQQGWLSAYISLSNIGVNNQTESSWYCGIIKAIIDRNNGLNLHFDLGNWWNSEPKDTEKSLIRQLKEFIQSKLWSLLPPEDQDKNLLITIDEIDTVLSLPFSTDDFFALIRDFYNDRDHIPNLDRLAFCFLGVADHNDLMTDINRTPFNNATFIDLKGFTFEEGKQGLFDELAKIVEKPDEVLKEIIEKTGGQPYLSQLLCDKIYFKNQKNPNIDQLITTYIINKCCIIKRSSIYICH